MTRSRDLDPVLLVRYLSGESTPAEAAQVSAWLAADARHRIELDDLRREWSSVFPLERPIDVDAAWRNVAVAMHGGDGAQSATDVSGPLLRLEQPLHRVPVHHTHSALRRPIVHAPTRTARLARLAVAAVLVVSAGMVVHERRSSNTPESITRTARDYIAKKGERVLVDLADGTHIVLAPGTHLHVSLPTSGRGVRDVTLDGEAMFTVVHDTARPFVVHTRYGTTTDVGTSFAVRAFSDEAYRVVVREGRVALGDVLGGERGPMLVAGDVATRGSDGSMHVTHGQDASAMLDWTNGRLTFRHTRFADLVPELERWYGVDIRIATPVLGDRLVTGQLDAESRSEAMDALGRTLGAQHMADGSRVTFWLPQATR